VWVVSHNLPGNTFMAQLVTSAGVSAAPVQSSVGFFVTQVGAGCMKISPTGRKLGLANLVPMGGPGFEIFDFDNSTGQISNPLAIFEGGILGGYGCEFSPDGTKFYGAAGPSATELYQWDLCAGSGPAILASKYKIVSTKMAQLQLAKNGKIYISRYTTNTLAVIDSPNLGGPACNFIPIGVTLPWPQACRLGLPNFVCSYFEKPATFTPFTYTVNPAISCLTATFAAPQASLATGTCTQVVTNPVASVIWQFGDPASGAANTSTLNSPTHAYLAPGIYTVQATLLNGCGATLTTIQQAVVISSLTIGSASTFSMCSGKSLTLTAGGGGSATTYSWSNGATGSLVIVSPTATTVYTVTGAGVNNCGLGTRTVYVMPVPQVTVPNPVKLCVSASTVIIASGANNYIWTATSGILHGGPGGFTISTSTSANYTVTGITPYGCTNSATFDIIALPRPSLALSGNSSVCLGGVVSLTVSGASSYTWFTLGSNWTINTFPGNAGQLSFTPTVGNTTLFVTGEDFNGCSASQALTILSSQSNAVTSFSYPPACSGVGSVSPVMAAQFSQNGIFSSGDLQVNATTGVVDGRALAPGTYTVKYSVNTDTCTLAGSYIAQLVVQPPEMLDISPSVIIAPGETTMLQVSSGENYSWSPAENLSCNTCSNPIASPKETTQYCVTVPDQCHSKACVEVIVSCDAKMNYSVPNAFSPNGDGRNDEFCLKGWSTCSSVFNVMIFDRWGEKVFESSDPGFCWDGTYHGRKLAADVFVYVIRSETTKQVVNKKGNITLIR
jgi:gliding motility-associated-like protein